MEVTKLTRFLPEPFASFVEAQWEAGRSARWQEVDGVRRGWHAAIEAAKEQYDAFSPALDAKAAKCLAIAEAARRKWIEAQDSYRRAAGEAYGPKHQRSFTVNQCTAKLTNDPTVNTLIAPYRRRWCDDHQRTRNGNYAGDRAGTNTKRNVFGENIATVHHMVANADDRLRYLAGIIKQADDMRTGTLTLAEMRDALEKMDRGIPDVRHE